MRKYSATLPLFVFLCSCLLTGTISFAQQKTDLYKPDPRLYQCIDRAFLDKLQAEKSELIIYYNFYLENCYYTAPLKAEKAASGIDIHTVTLKKQTEGKTARFNERYFDKKKFNPLKYNFNFGMSIFTAYIWEEAGIAVICRSSEAIAASYKNYLNSLGIKE